MISAVMVPQFKVIVIAILRQSGFLNNCFSNDLQLVLSQLKIALAALLGASLGFSRNSRARATMGIVITMAQSIRNCLTSSTEVFLSMRKLGTEAPMVMESRPTRMPEKVTIPTRSLLNQFRATLLGVFKMKMLPIAASIDPSRQQNDCPTASSNLSQTPPTSSTAPTMNPTRIPYLLISQLQGSAKTGWAMVKSSALRVTSMPDIWKVSSMMTLMLEKVCTAMELTRAATRQAARMTKRQGSWGQVLSLFAIIMKVGIRQSFDRPFWCPLLLYISLLSDTFPRLLQIFSYVLSHIDLSSSFVLF